MACSSTGSTSDGVSFDLCDLRKEKTRSKRKKLLIKKIDDTMTSLESKSGEKSVSFCIGKSFAEAPKDGTPFDPMNGDTWDIRGGVGNRWRSYYKINNYHGLVVLAAVTSDMLDKKCNTKVWNEELYTLALESALISHYAFDVFDHRLDNTSLNPGSSKDSAAGYVIYLAFKYKETKETEREITAEKEEEKSKESEGTLAKNFEEKLSVK